MGFPSLQSIRTVFFGSPAFALPSFEALRAAGANLVGVVTQPDKPAGHGHRLTAPPVKVWAEQRGIPVFQPTGLKKEENRAFLRTLAPDLLVVVAYGKILPKEVLDLPKRGAVNVHASLLPKYRGPAPIPAAILAGETETGVTIMKLDEGMDTGPLLAQERVPIALEDAAGTLARKLADVGAQLLLPTLERYIEHELFPATRSLGEVWPTPQDNGQASVCPMLKKDDGRIDWTKAAEHIARMVRAYDPWPRAFTTWRGKQLLILQAVPWASSAPTGGPEVTTGIVSREPTGGVTVQTGRGKLQLLNVQLAGRKPLTIEQFLLGHPLLIGSTLGTASPRQTI
ncbi:MAG: methionyl-tRNA formyltransferase [Parcubacteria group bacterium Gr01-1014_38]|nr:MAG: methionyl-tRNA formyltransferase [Parcubacteria group bacterium Gr01-1014_38]